MTVIVSSTGNEAWYTVWNNYTSSYVYTLTCSIASVGSCTAIKNAAGTTITTINIAANSSAQVKIVFAAAASPTSGNVTLSATNGIWSGSGANGVTVLPPPPQTGVSAVLWNHNRNGIDRGLCFTSGAGAAAGSSCGDLFVTHGMPSFRTMGRDRALTLLYNSATSRGQALVAAKVTQPSGTAAPSTLRAILSIGGKADTSTYAGVAPGSTVQIVVGDRLSSTLATGVYPFTLALRNSFTSPVTVVDSVITDTLVVVNNRFKEFGRGWSLVGVERLYLNQPSSTSDILWTAGDGSALRYRSIGGNKWVAPAADFRDTITYNPGAMQYTRFLRHGAKVIYDGTGAHIQTVNRYGQVTEFVYTTFVWGNPEIFFTNRLTAIRVPGNDAVVREYKLFWSAAPYFFLDSIADPGGRKLKVTRSGSAVTAFTDVDGQQVQFVYGGPDSLLSARRIQNPVVAGGWAQTSYSYAGRSKLIRTRIQAGPTGLDSTIMKSVPWQVNGLDSLQTGLTAPAFPTSPVPGFPTFIDGPIAGTLDGFTTWLNYLGQPIRTLVSGTNAITEYYRDSLSMPALVTRIVYPNSRLGLMTYNARGNLVMQRDSTWGANGGPTNTTTWAYGDPNFPDSPTATADALGRLTTTTLHSTFGVPTQVTEPSGHVTTFGYLSNGLLQTVTEQAVEVWVQATQSDTIRNLTTTFEYDGMGQVKRTTAPNGAFSVWQSDSLGRVTATWDPFNTRTRFTYDALNRVTATTADTGVVANPLGATNNCVAAEFICSTAVAAWTTGTPASFVTTAYYGQVGVDSIISPRSVPRGFRYDAGGAVIRELDHDSTVANQAVYNVNGQVESTVSRDSQTVRFKYDELGRMYNKVWLARTWPALYDDGRLARPAATIPGDSIRYTYDYLGRLLLIAGVNDSVARTYWENGLVKTAVSNRLMIDSLRYRYDATGAMLSKYHVTADGNQVARDSTHYFYNATSGRLDSMVVTIFNPGPTATRRVAFVWDALGRRRTVRYPNDHEVNIRYDAAGNLRRLVSGILGANGSFNCGLTYSNLCVSVANDSVDLRGAVLHTLISCMGVKHTGWACGDFGTREAWNTYYRNGWLARQLDGYHSDSTIIYDASGNIARRWDYGIKVWHNFTYQPRTNRLVRDSTGPAYIYWQNGCVFASCTDSGTVNRYSWTTYSASGSRLTDSTTRGRRTPTSPERAGPGYSDRYYYYDAAGRTTGIAHFDQYHWSTDGNNSWFTPIGGGNDCLYDVEGRMVRVCGAGNDVAYEGQNISATNNGVWHFFSGPGTDDPIFGIGQAQGVIGGPGKELYWVTDGQGRQYGVAMPNGDWDANTFEPGNNDLWMGYLQAGATRNAQGYNASRSESRSIPGVSYFRNRVYDQASGQWTQEDPIGLAGGSNLYQYGGGNPVSFTDPFGLCPKNMRGDPQKCQDWNNAQKEKAKEALKKEHDEGNPHALQPPEKTRIFASNDDAIEGACRGADHVTKTGCSTTDEEGWVNITVNVDRTPEAISATIVHELQHQLPGSGREPHHEMCAQFRASQYVRMMGQTARDAATSNGSGGLPARMDAAPQSQSRCGF